jgi:hypothetical protein
MADRIFDVSLGEPSWDERERDNQQSKSEGHGLPQEGTDHD